MSARAVVAGDPACVGTEPAVKASRGCPMVPAWGLTVAAAEAAALVLGASGWALGGLHLVLAGLTPGVWRRLGRAPLAARRAGWLTLGAPVVGAFAAACLPTAAGSAQLEVEESGGEPLLGPLETSPPPARFRGVWELETDLREGDLEARLAAVRALKALSNGAGVPALRAALTAGDQQSALLASLALAELEQELEGAIAAARADMDADDPTPLQLLVLAAALRRYAASGLPAPVAAAQAWLDAANAAELALAPGASGAMAAQAGCDLAAARLALGRPDLALDAADAALAARPGDPAAALARLEALFALGEHDRLRAAALDLRANAPPGCEAHDDASFWCAEDEARAA